MELTPTRRGAIAELAIAYRATELGVEVYWPASEGTRSDMIFEVGEDLFRVQCKTGRLSKGAIIVNTQTCRRTADGFLRTKYTPDEVDVIAAYCPENWRCYLIPLDDIPECGRISLRLSRAKNNQLKRLHFAAEYELDQGAIAQLGERSAGSRKVAGSNPASSTQEPRVARLFS